MFYPCNLAIYSRVRPIQNFPLSNSSQIMVNLKPRSFVCFSSVKNNVNLAVYKLLTLLVNLAQQHTTEDDWNK